jgi:hypothetical protein
MTVEFEEKCEFSADPSEVWTRVSNLDAIPTYWHGTKEFKVMRSGEKSFADVVFAFGGKGKAEVVVDESERRLTIDYVDGPFKGRQTIAVRNNTVEAEWNVAFKGAFKLLGPWNESHFKSGTRNALKRLCSTSAELWASARWFERLDGTISARSEPPR